MVKKEKLPAPEHKERRKLIQDYLSQRATVRLPECEALPWWYKNCLYFTPDSGADINQVEWEVKDEDCLTKKQAIEIWQRRGCKSLRSPIQTV